MKKYILLPVLFFAANVFAQTGNMIGLNVGNIAPEIIEKGVNDSLLKLSDLRGKVVLIDFWASWCGPCRHENPNVVKTYKQYKDSSFTSGEGFTVFSVSLDRDKPSWLKAIEHDSLVWPYHVSDLGYWNSKAAQLYQVFSIPTNFLIDGNGVIIAKGLREGALPAALSTITVHKKNGKERKPKKQKKEKKKKSDDHKWNEFGILEESTGNGRSHR